MPLHLFWGSKGLTKVKLWVGPKQRVWLVRALCLVEKSFRDSSATAWLLYYCISSRDMWLCSMYNTKERTWATNLLQLCNFHTTGASHTRVGRVNALPRVCIDWHHARWHVAYFHTHNLLRAALLLTNAGPFLHSDFPFLKSWQHLRQDIFMEEVCHAHKQLLIRDI